MLNLLADRRRTTIDVAILSGGDARPLDATISIVYALEDSAVAIDESYALAADEALRVDGAGRTALRSQAGRVALATDQFA